MRVLIPSLLALFSLTASAKKFQPTPTDACQRIVQVRVNTYDASPSASERASYQAACMAELTKAEGKALKKQVQCAFDAVGSEAMNACGEQVQAAYASFDPFLSTMAAACNNQVEISVAFAGAELTPELQTKLHTDCMNDMTLHNALNTPAEMVKKTTCMAQASEQDQSEACWD
jgi:hypothetical protein